MTDRPIIFSAAMVLSLLAGRKTQTRRLATSPLRNCAPGDRLYLREAHRLTDCPCTEACRGAGHVWYEADDSGYRNVASNKLRPSIHMPRWASRATLTVIEVRVEPLMPISDADARAEGLIAYRAEELPGHQFEAWHWLPGITDRAEMFGSASSAYAALWNDLHTQPGERWQDNPNVVALTFSVASGNIDQTIPNILTAKEAGR